MWRSGTGGCRCWLLAIARGPYRRPCRDLLPAQAAETKVPVPAGSLAWPAGWANRPSVCRQFDLGDPRSQTAAPISQRRQTDHRPIAFSDKNRSPGQQGPTITLSASDVALYNAYVAQQGSVVPVAAGEQISQYQMLQAIMLPSANNMADSLAIWAFGSLDAYATYANNYVARLGLSATHIGSDASGFAPNTISSAARPGQARQKSPCRIRCSHRSSASQPPAVCPSPVTSKTLISCLVPATSSASRPATPTRPAASS